MTAPMVFMAAGTVVSLPGFGLFDILPDGLSDGAEVLGPDAIPASGDETEPLDDDSDDDLVLDGPDNCKLVANASQQDADADGYGDACDNYPVTINPDQLDRGGIGTTTPYGVDDLCQNGDFDGAVDLTAGAVVDAMQQKVVLGTAALVSVREPSAPLMWTFGALALGLLQRRRERRRA